MADINKKRGVLIDLALALCYWVVLVGVALILRWLTC